LLWGGAGDDVLDGMGGADTLNGEGGNDTYYIDVAGDVVWEAVGAGIDTVISSVNNYSLRNNFENLVLAGSTANGGGNALDNIVTGNATNNVIWGGGGSDALNGLDGSDQLSGEAGNDRLDGGLGADQLFGGADADTYVFSSSIGSGNIDVIFGFSSADDTIELDLDVFTSLNAGTLDAGAFRIGSAAGDADDRIIYDSATGALYYDADGNGAGAAIQFATLATGLSLTNNDFIVGP
jgi:serralysin